MITEDTAIDEIVDFIKSKQYPAPVPDGNEWTRWANVQAAFRIAARDFEKEIPVFPTGEYHGRGIILCGGGTKYFPSVWVAVNAIRHHGCNLPIQVWYLGRNEMDDYMAGLLREFGAEPIDAIKVREQFPARILNGWEVKCYAAIYCPFDDVLFIDADNAPAKDPTYLFDSDAYKKFGAYFFPDWEGGLPKEACDILGVPFKDNSSFESGQFMVKKSRCWKELHLTMWWNEFSDYTYHIVYGDKETFHAAWLQSGKPYYMVQKMPEGYHGFQQYDHAGELIFLHRNKAKWTLNSDNPRLELPQENLGHQWIGDLAARWSGIIGRGAPPMKGQSKDGFAVGFVTYTQYLKLEASLESIWAGSAQPSMIVIVDNGGGYVPKYPEKVQVVRPVRNLGVAASWNLIHVLTEPLPVVICNDDIIFGADALREMIAAPGDIVVAKDGFWSCFRQDHALWRTVGFYDELFYPAYCEDSDFQRRLTLAGVSINYLPVDIHHDGGGTRFSLPSSDRSMIEWYYDLNRDYYEKKWGGPIGGERFAIPFNDPDYYQQPSPRNLLTSLYSQACITTTDIYEHLPVLKRYATQCEHITEFGTKQGQATLAFLIAQPKTLVCYSGDGAARFTADRLRTVQCKTALAFVEADVLNVQIDETDLLFIDTYHTYRQLLSELNLHSDRVKKFIIMHDTSIFGDQGEDGSPGLWPAIREFLEHGRAFWKLSERLLNNNGLIVLQRLT